MEQLFTLFLRQQVQLFPHFLFVTRLPLAAQSEIGLWYIEKGMRFGCRISVPPEPSRFVGQITVGWATPPADLDQTKAMLNIAATMLSRSKK